MPAYKVEKYIGKAIKSILRQTFPDWELIVVDDCSPDRSREIAAAYAKEDDRICVLCQEENRGVSAARNLGIEKACGKYIWCVGKNIPCSPAIFTEPMRFIFCWKGKGIFLSGEKPIGYMPER